MTDSNETDALDAKHERNREQRIEGIKRWVEYIQSEPPEVWGPQQNAVVEAQLEAAQNAGLSASHRQQVEDVAAEIRDVSDEELEERISAHFERVREALDEELEDGE